MLKRMLTASALGLGLLLANTPAHAVGCFSGALAGGAAGHLAHHGILGAIGGCVAGHAYHKHQMHQQDLQDQNTYQQRRQSYDNDSSLSRTQPNRE